MSELGRNEDIALTCEYVGCEDDCPKECSTCAIAIKTDGDAALSENKLPSAIRFYKRAVFLVPRFAEAWNNLANAYNMINEPLNALEAFNKAIAIDEEYGKALFGKAMTLRKLGLLDEAMQLANDILDLYSADEVLTFKKELVAEGVEDTHYIVENEAFSVGLDNYCCEIADVNDLLDSQEFYDAIEECGEAYQPDDFIEKVMKYCRKKYAPLGEEKVRGEYIITSFYGAICAALFYFEDDTIYDDCGQYEYLKDHIDIEFTDVNAERMLQTKAGEEKAEHIWGIISPYVKFANDIFDKASKLTDELILCAMKNAYEIGMLTANHYYSGKDKKHSECIEIHTERSVMTKGVPSDYFFVGDTQNPSGTMNILTPLNIDVEVALQKGVPGRETSLDSKCVIIAENDEFIFYKYGCYPDGSSGCNLRQSKTQPDDIVFFGRAKMLACIYHNHLIQVNHMAYGNELYLFTRDVNTGKEKIYPWFGKYSIPTGRGSRYDQDHVLNMKIDNDSDCIIIEVRRQSCEFASQTDEDYICNKDTEYKLVVKYYDNDFHAIAEYSELNVRQIFKNVY